ncbi:MAG: homogentisate 1,2-dioxygenase [Saprospiraceae bacterium]|jgi:homogentisate 1,2-dioxygenase|nr:homogentisate 1,2-dioxygenase [Saprospiraceae bacterium]MCA0334719.1 homogentisate 1,2-dioxygenase [Bacteroidota bacterium]MCO5276416.1 homogentisate 1,2-dioxygenase [Saprospiraceae bacterium]
MHYFSSGQIPPKRHTQFRKPDGNLYYEELFSTEGFHDKYSILYHINHPTRIIQVGAPIDVSPQKAETEDLKPRSLYGFRIQPEDDYIRSRKVVLFNSDIHMSLAAPTKGTDDYFFKNADCDEVVFIHQGSGVMRSAYGVLPFKYGDYIVIPRGTVYQMNFDTTDNRLLIIESRSPITTPRHYRSEYGQLLEHSPFCERDIIKPTFVDPIDERGDFKFFIKKKDKLYPYEYMDHPFDLIGWDGFHYPYIFSIHNFEPITGRVHQPPPVHLTFVTKTAVICSFVPRLYDYHPLAIPAPYFHSNIDSDEVLYYVDGEFMSRKHVERGQITLHPGGIPHGPHPGAIEKSIGAKSTEELAVMLDTFAPLYLTNDGLGIEDAEYYRSWLS